MANAPKVIDLYAGVGGLSLSAVNAGFDLIAAVEAEKRIIDSHSKNFPNSIHICSDVSKLDHKALISSAKLGKDELAGLIGGPPCQGFSQIGKRSISDERNDLFISFFKLVSKIEPVFYLAENVPGILDNQNIKIRNKATVLVEGKYKVLEPIIIGANDFGAATTRKRIFFIGVRNDVKGSESIQASIEKMKTKKATIVKEALAGLPIQISREWIDYNSSWRRVEASLFNAYIKSINEFKDKIGDPFSIKRFEKKKEVSGCFGTRHSKEVAKRYSKLLAGQQDKISKSLKLNADGFCPTLRAGTDSSKGSFQAVRPIHYSEARVITPREAARLQGFPDWFQFHETKWHSFRQIGNSVCPIAGKKVLLAIKASLNM
jgi:DNA (cytosine-5)-methyltransferase 1